MINRVLTVALLLVLALYCVAGLFARPLADDLAFIELAKVTNPVVEQYYFWQGRFSFTVMNGVVMPIAPTLIVRIMPMVLIVCMVAGGYHLLKRVVLNPLMASSGLVLAFLVSLPSVWQSVYWFSASSNYLLPLAAGLLVIVWLLR